MPGPDREINFKIYIRAIVSIIMLIVWVLVAVSGFVLWLAPAGPRSGRIPLLFALTKNDWREIHQWIAAIALIMTIIHIIIDWGALRSVIKYMVSIHRIKIPTQK